MVSQLTPRFGRLLQAQAGQIDELQKAVAQPNISSFCRHRSGAMTVEGGTCHNYPSKPAFFEGKDGDVWCEWKRTFLRYLKDRAHKG